MNTDERFITTYGGAVYTCVMYPIELPSFVKWVRSLIVRSSMLYRGVAWLGARVTVPIWGCPQHVHRSPPLP